MAAVEVVDYVVASGSTVQILKIHPTQLSIFGAFLEVPSCYETKQARELAHSRTGLALTPVKPLQNSKVRQVNREIEFLGDVVCLSDRAIHAANGHKLIAPLHSLRNASYKLSRGQILINGNYFLFNPPDLLSPWDAYGDPLGLSIVDNQIQFPPQVSRACLLWKNNRAFIKRLSFNDCLVRDATNRLFHSHAPGPCINEDAGTAYALYFGSLKGRTPVTPNVYDVAFVGRHAVAIKSGGGMPIARSGCVLRYESLELALAGSSSPLTYELSDGYEAGLQCGPLLVELGESTEIERDVFEEEQLGLGKGLHDLPSKCPYDWKADWHKTRAARLAVGLTAEGSLFVTAVEGGSSLAVDGLQSQGATLSDLAQLMIDQGAVTAMNLDGGGSVQAYNAVGGALILSHDVYHDDLYTKAQIDRPLPLGIILA